jgi:hypothetical protein
VVCLRTGQAKAAEAAFQRAAAIWRRLCPDSTQLARIRLCLARAVYLRDPEYARLIAANALHEHQQAASPDPRVVQRLSAWISQHAA